MKIEKFNNYTIAHIDNGTQINSTQDMLDIFATVSYHENADNLALILNENSLHADFFNLSTKFAGDLLQKFSNYNVKISIVGDFTKYNSNSLQAFIRECNRGRHVFFSSTANEAKNKIAHSYFTHY